MTIHPINPFQTFKLLLLAAVMVNSIVSTCVTIHGEQREIIDAREILNSQLNIADCLRSSLTKGNTALARSIVELYDSQHQKVMQRVVEEELLRLKQLQVQVVQSESTCEPVAKWGQNTTHIFVSLKMSHRWDSPPCLNTKLQSTLSSPQNLNYTNVCLVANSKITFSFQLQFYDNVAAHPHPITFSRDGVGIYSAIIEKEVPKVWPFLGRDQKSYPIWSEISERHNSVHKEYEALLNGILRAKKSKPVIVDQAKKETAIETKAEDPQIVPVEQPISVIATNEEGAVQPAAGAQEPVDLLTLKKL